MTVVVVLEEIQPWNFERAAVDLNALPASGARVWGHGLRMRTHLMSEELKEAPRVALQPAVVQVYPGDWASKEKGAYQPAGSAEPAKDVAPVVNLVHPLPASPPLRLPSLSGLEPLGESLAG